jgi:glycine/D-amino acid oxidase-like deaminating enzyme/nitrite reductase/ring-hydroxylating ferredoxin subunit
MTDRARDKNTVWSHAALPAFPPLAMDHTTTVCVVGAGVAGLTTAYLLAKEGSQVIVLDDGLVGGGESGLTTAQLVTALDRRWADLARLHTGKSLHVAAASHAAAIDRIERIVGEEDIACELQRLPGYLFAGAGQSSELIHAEVAAAQNAGLGLVKAVERAPLMDFDTGPAARFPDQAQLHVLRYLAGLARAVERLGGRIYTEAHVTEIDENAAGGQVVVKTSRGVSVRADHGVLATNTPFLPRISIHLKQVAVRSYVIAMPVPKDSVFPALYWDTEEPLHYVRLTNLGGADGPEPVLLVGGEDHPTGVDGDSDKHYARLEAWARERFPRAGAVLHRWSGQVMETVDGLAYIGRLEEKSRIFVATGDCGTGMTHGTIAGMIITDLVHGRPNEWADTYDPARINLSARAVSGFVKGAVRTAGHYAQWLGGGDLTDVEQLPPGEGAIMRKGLHMLAVYRDPRGEVHERSAVCPHLGCLVAWNASERTWDCPCHGSRFTCTGKVMHGPATGDLAHVEDELAKAG